MRFLGIVALVLGLALGAQADSLNTVALAVEGRGDSERQQALFVHVLHRPLGLPGFADEPVDSARSVPDHEDLAAQRLREGADRAAALLALGSAHRQVALHVVWAA